MQNNSISHEQVNETISYTTQEGNHPVGAKPEAREPKKLEQQVEVVDVDVVDEDSPDKHIAKYSKIKYLESDYGNLSQS